MTNDYLAWNRNTNVCFKDICQFTEDKENSDFILKVGHGFPAHMSAAAICSYPFRRKIEFLLYEV